ncbi:MAG TPA: class I SAM-dependent methyltransferase [Gemmatimonadaceae bacterium]|nr:class I SAM-dependent methyltransferase [Gemmatimonadaceae bacterium]
MSYSRTAMYVAYLRALADAGASHVRDFHDPTARALLDARWARRLARVERALRAGKDGLSLAFARVQADMMALRTEAIDAAVRDAIAAGATQLVILGAGFDGRAWRMAELGAVRVLEVDQPATQAAKRSRIAALPSAIARVTYVPVDFRHDALAGALERAGHDAARPTCWIWEGVVMYLARDAMRSTLADVRRLSAVGSTLIVNYHTAMPPWLAAWVLRLVREPMRSSWSPEEMALELSAAGFRVREDSGVAEWAARFATGPVNLRAGHAMRIVVARRVADALDRAGFCPTDTATDDAPAAVTLQ